METEEFNRVQKETGFSMDQFLSILGLKKPEDINIDKGAQSIFEEMRTIRKSEIWKLMEKKRDLIF